VQVGVYLELWPPNVYATQTQPPMFNATTNLTPEDPPPANALKAF